MAFTCQGQNGTVGPPGRSEISNGRREHERNSVNGVYNTCANFVRVPSNWIKTEGSQPGPWISNEVSLNLTRPCLPYLYKFDALLAVRREGLGTAVANLRGCFIPEVNKNQKRWAGERYLSKGA